MVERKKGGPGSEPGSSLVASRERCSDARAAVSGRETHVQAKRGGVAQNFVLRKRILGETGGLQRVLVGSFVLSAEERLGVRSSFTNGRV